MCAHVAVQLERLSAEIPAHGALALRQSVFSPHHRANPEQHQAGVQAHAEEETSGEQLPADRLLLPPRLTATLLHQQHSHTARCVLRIGVPLQTGAAALHAEAGGDDLRASAEGARGEGAGRVRRDLDDQTRRTIRRFREVHPRPVDEAVRGAARQLYVCSGLVCVDGCAWRVRLTCAFFPQMCRERAAPSDVVVSCGWCRALVDLCLCELLTLRIGPAGSPAVPIASFPPLGTELLCVRLLSVRNHSLSLQRLSASCPRQRPYTPPQLLLRSVALVSLTEPWIFIRL